VFTTQNRTTESRWRGLRQESVLSPRSAGQSSTSRKLRVKRRYNQTACRMMSGGNWWRANEISMGHLTHERDVDGRRRDKTAASDPDAQGSPPQRAGRREKPRRRKGRSPSFRPSRSSGRGRRVEPAGDEKGERLIWLEPHRREQNPPPSRPRRKLFRRHPEAGRAEPG
jgi:hypothetical protein